MKAKFVKENFNFDRGIDPKKAMKIGNRWLHLEIGDILLAKDRVVVEEGEEKLVFMTPDEYDEKFPEKSDKKYYYTENDVAVVKKIDILPDYKILLMIIPFSRLDGAEEISQAIKNGRGQIYAAQEGEGTSEEWSRFFEIL